MSGARPLATRLYLRAARVAGDILQRSPLVEGVCVRRSVASGEVSFGRSDIDLAVTIRGELPHAAALAELLRRFRTLRPLIPVLGECLVYDDIDRRTWWWTDTYRASIDRRAAIHLAGVPFGIPPLPVRPEHAARRCVFWLDGYLPVALRRGNRRNLRKFALEMWNAMATSKGIFTEPLLTRAETADRWGEERLNDRNPETLARLCFEVAGQLHAQLLPGLRPAREVHVLEAELPPAYRRRTVVILPEAGSAIPAETRRTGALILTPEALHLYLEYLNPFAAAALPADVLTRLGTGQPSRGAFVRACRSYGASLRTRAPGFEHCDTATPGQLMRTCLHAAGFLRDGRTPPFLAPERMASPPLRDYYRSVYPRLRGDCEELWSVLDTLPEEIN